ncbi:MAG: hypothetical protein A3E64_01925 [Candidatus Harrisonbacteria bacterium RIFCSPHIGHO2_12_FULL_48_16]|uniref:Uncharacterized protein n=1 Tax=Candidatus Harrisonbacteria bacterium RIFCSPHIGHO2_12_FULL_48_16 TaxID=1798405 RepID=A0A1G1ZIC3_9BACT|nr:MAG: hypothetical protein A3E64_01925 [Candidatus Harrisonbacteria bacterium RIFCSPHIGHO2_12_FULL_48_16]OHA25169.1 MAG: hypothetical protein A3D52_00340 [Candidatus Taylorbacteria bacterium RIFCSPHIGHO2_02_FULL_44_36]
MSTAILQKNYKRLENRLETLEQIIGELFVAGLKEGKVKMLEKVSKELDKGRGKRFFSYRKFQQYLKSL